MMTHGDVELDLDYEDDEVRRAQNEIKSECVEEYAFPSICFLKLESPVYAEYQAIETYDKGRSLCHSNRMLLDSTYHIKWL